MPLQRPLIDQFQMCYFLLLVLFILNRPPAVTVDKHTRERSWRKNTKTSLEEKIQNVFKKLNIILISTFFVRLLDIKLVLQ